MTLGDSPELEPSQHQQMRIEQLRHIIGGIVRDHEVKIETHSTGFRLSLHNGLSIRLHTGNEEISTVQELNVMSSDTAFEIYFEPHSFEEESLGILARSIYRIGRKGIRVARKPKNIEEASPQSDQPASDSDSLRLTAALSRLFYRERNPDD